MDSPQFADDLARAASEAQAFNAAYKGQLETLAKDETGVQLAAAIAGYEALEELLGKIMSFAGLTYSSDTSDVARAKFYGDAQEKVTAASSDLLFFELELNRLEEGALDKALADGPLARYRPWIADIRKGKPYQLDDRIEQLFHEKSVTAYGAWNRLFDETITAMRFDVDGEKLAVEPVLNLMQAEDEASNRRRPRSPSARASRTTCAPSP